MDVSLEPPHLRGHVRERARPRQAHELPWHARDSTSLPAFRSTTSAFPASDRIDDLGFSFDIGRKQQVRPLHEPHPRIRHHPDRPAQMVGGPGYRPDLQLLRLQHQDILGIPFDCQSGKHEHRGRVLKQGSTSTSDRAMTLCVGGGIHWRAFAYGGGSRTSVHWSGATAPLYFIRPPSSSAPARTGVREARTGVHTAIAERRRSSLSR